MKRIVLGILIVAATWSAAEAKGGKATTPIPPSYDYTREKATGYKKDYCLDAVGNHIYCVTNSSVEDGKSSTM